MGVYFRGRRLKKRTDVVDTTRHGHGAEGPPWGHEEPVDRTRAASYPLRHEAFVAGLNRPMTLEDEP